MTDATATMGSILPNETDGRDAVHVAVIAVTAGQDLYPGQHVGLDKHQMTAHPTNDFISPSDLVGIVDPFIGEMAIPKGKRFWLFLYPRTITSLRHQWTHPAFEDTDTKYAAPAARLRSEEWLRDWVNKSDCPGYGWFMDQAEEIASGTAGWPVDGEYLHVSGSAAHGDIPPEVWEHVEVVLGRKIDGNKPKYFSCSC